MRQTYLYGIAIAAALGFAPPANAGMVSVPTIRPSLPKITPPKVTLQTPRAGGHGGGQMGGTLHRSEGRHEDHRSEGRHESRRSEDRHEGHTSQTTKVTTQTPTVTTQTPKATYDITIGRVQ